MASTNTETRKRARKESGGKALTAIGMVLGAGLGAAVGLVHSPGTGKKNRKNLNLWAHHRLDDLQRKAEGVVKRDT
jgi:gas vesicle protein